MILRHKKPRNPKGIKGGQRRDIDILTDLNRILGSRKDKIGLHQAELATRTSSKYLKALVGRGWFVWPTNRKHFDQQALDIRRKYGIFVRVRKHPFGIRKVGSRYYIFRKGGGDSDIIPEHPHRGGAKGQGEPAGFAKVKTNEEAYEELR